MTGNPYERDLDKNPANFVPLTPLDPDRARRRRLSRTARPSSMATRRQSWAETYARCRRLASALAQARHRRRRHGRGHGAERARALRGAFRRADGRRRAQRAQHPARRRDHRLHPRSRRGQGADHRPRILADHQGRAREARPQDPGHRHRRPGGARRRALGRDGLRGVRRRRRPRLRLAHADGRVGSDRAQLHLGHHRQSQGRRLPPSRRVPERDGQHPRLVDAAAPGLSLDPADVPLQRLVLPLDAGGRGRHQRLSAPGRGRSRSSAPSPTTASRISAARRSC